MSANRARAGFTLAEVAVTLVIVAIGPTLVLQGLNTSKMSAAQTHNRKVARELALLTLGVGLANAVLVERVLLPAARAAH